MKNYKQLKKAVLKNRSLLENDWFNIYEIENIDLSLWGQEQLKNEIYYILDEHE